MIAISIIVIKYYNNVVESDKVNNTTITPSKQITTLNDVLSNIIEDNGKSNCKDHKHIWSKTKNKNK